MKRFLIQTENEITKDGNLISEQLLIVKKRSAKNSIEELEKIGCKITGVYPISTNNFYDKIMKGE